MSHCPSGRRSILTDIRSLGLRSSRELHILVCVLLPVLGPFVSVHTIADDIGWVPPSWEEWFHDPAMKQSNSPPGCHSPKSLARANHHVKCSVKRMVQVHLAPMAQISDPQFAGLLTRKQHLTTRATWTEATCNTLRVHEPTWAMDIPHHLFAEL